MQKTNFQLVGDFHKQYGHPSLDTFQANFLDDAEAVEKRMNLINEEHKETIAGVLTKDQSEVIDGLVDMLYVIYGMGQTFGIDLDKAFCIVHEANMKKICETEEEAIDSIKQYAVDPEFVGVTVNYRLAPDGKKFVLYNAQSGKILKSKLFVKPDFSNWK